MKNTIVLILVITLVCVCTGCMQENIVDSDGVNHNQETTMPTSEDCENANSETVRETSAESSEASTSETEIVTTEISDEPTDPADPGEPPTVIEVRSLEDLLMMKEMIACEDKELVQEYLAGWGISKDDLISFVSLVETTPYVPLVEGKITWISYMTGISVDTNEPYKILYVSTETDDGDWVRLEYLLSVKDVEDKIARELADEGTKSLITSPLHSKDGKITFHIETREKHPTYPGDVINWVANVDGIFTRVVYYTTDADKVVTTDMLSKVEASQIPASEVK